MQAVVPGNDFCNYCDRDFVDHVSYLQHLNDSWQHEYCSRCQVFCNTKHSTLAGHEATSRHHWPCTVVNCHEDLESSTELEMHRQKGHPYLCKACNYDCKSHYKLQSHNQAKHNPIKPNTAKPTPAEPKTVKPAYVNQDPVKPTQVEPKVMYQSKNTDCCRCDRLFISESAAMHHLESGNCESGWNYVRVNEAAEQCFQSKKYVVQEYAYLLKYDYGRGVLNSFPPYKCPCCESFFVSLSGLLQHVEGNTCDETIEGGALGKCIRWLEICEDDDEDGEEDDETDEYDSYDSDEDYDDYYYD